MGEKKEPYASPQLVTHKEFCTLTASTANTVSRTLSGTHGAPGWLRMCQPPSACRCYSFHRVRGQPFSTCLAVSLVSS